MRSLLALLAITFAVPAQAQGVTMITPLSCDKTEVLLKLLKDRYREQAIGGGISGQGELVRIFVSDTNTFSIIVTKPGGMSCFYTGGGDWTMKPMGDDL